MTDITAMPPWAAQFLLALRTTGVVSAAAREVGVTPGAVAGLRERSFDFDQAVEEALEEAVDSLEREAWRRARDGVEKPIYYQGVRVGSVTEHSDSLLQFLLKARRRSVFGDKQEITGANGGPLVLDDVSRAARVASLLELARQRQQLIGDDAPPKALPSGDTAGDTAGDPIDDLV
jgi:hypothetical protein